jgi:hypothetical protein
MVQPIDRRIFVPDSFTIYNQRREVFKLDATTNKRAPISSDHALVRILENRVLKEYRRSEEFKS